MSRPNCEHGPEEGWQPEPTYGLLDSKGVAQARPRCQTFVLTKMLQCSQPGRGEVPRYCENHSYPVETGMRGCLDCRAETNGKGQPTLEERATARAMRLRSDPAAVRRLLGDGTWAWFQAEVKDGSADIRAGNQSDGEERIVDAAADLGRLMTACILDELTQAAA